MKILITLVLLFTVSETQALDLKVHKMKKTHGFDNRFDLKTSVEEKVALDCQSFIQGLLFGPLGENAVMLQQWECDELVLDMKKSLGRFKEHCLVIDEVRSTLESHHTCE